MHQYDIYNGGIFEDSHVGIVEKCLINNECCVNYRKKFAILSNLICVIELDHSDVGFFKDETDLVLT